MRIQVWDYRKEYERHREEILSVSRGNARLPAQCDAHGLRVDERILNLERGLGIDENVPKYRKVSGVA